MQWGAATMLTKHSSSYYRQYEKQKAMKQVRDCRCTVRARATRTLGPAWPRFRAIGLRGRPILCCVVACVEVLAWLRPLTCGVVLAVGAPRVNVRAAVCATPTARCVRTARVQAPHDGQICVPVVPRGSAGACVCRMPQCDCSQVRASVLALAAAGWQWLPCVAPVCCVANVSRNVKRLGAILA